MPGQEFYLWQVRSFTVRVDLALVDNLNYRLADPRLKQGEEVGGILLGRKLSESEVELSDVEFVASAHRRGTIYDLGLREQLNFAKRAHSLSRRSGARSVGFFRTHVRRGLFLDQDDFSLMNEAFTDPSDIALLIRPVDPGPSNAGIFLWEDGDIDRRQTPLLFPFDSGTLRAQGPVESTVAPRLQKVARRTVPTPSRTEPRVIRVPAVPMKAIVWGAAACVGAFALSATLPHIHIARQAAAPAAKTTSVKPVMHADAAPPPVDPVEPTPQPEQSPSEAGADVAEAPVAAQFVTPKPDEGQAVEGHAVERMVVKSFVAPRIVPARDEPKQIAAIALPPVVIPRPDASAIPESIPRLNLPPREREVRVAVDVETKQSSQLARVVSHVPLFGHAVRAEGGSRFSPARPNRALEPRVPQDLASNLTGDLAVDVKLSIDKQGKVVSAEVLHGGDTQFAGLAANNAGGASWEPARDGDHRIATDVIVHYRFSPASVAQQ